MKFSPNGSLFEQDKELRTIYGNFFTYFANQKFREVRQNKDERMTRQSVMLTSSEAFPFLRDGQSSKTFLIQRADTYEHEALQVQASLGGLVLTTEEELKYNTIQTDYFVKGRKFMTRKRLMETRNTDFEKAAPNPICNYNYGEGEVDLDTMEDVLVWMSHAKAKANVNNVVSH